MINASCPQKLGKLWGRMVSTNSVNFGGKMPSKTRLTSGAKCPRKLRKSHNNYWWENVCQHASRHFRRFNAQRRLLCVRLRTELPNEESADCVKRKATLRTTNVNANRKRKLLNLRGDPDESHFVTYERDYRLLDWSLSLWGERNDHRILFSSHLHILAYTNNWAIQVN